MASLTCPGLSAAWLNGWLAAVGVTVLHAGMRLHWTEDQTPVAVFSTDEGDPLDALEASWPDRELLDELPIAENWGGTGPMNRKVPVDMFAARVQAARGHPNAWVLSSTMTDLIVDREGEVAHAPFDPVGPGTIKWLHHRLLKVHAHVTAPRQQIGDSLAGLSVRVKDNGLGFDVNRLGSLADTSGKWVDPVVEALAFFGLAFFPVRGRGSDLRLGRTSSREVQRGWRSTTGNRKDRRFVWPAWSQPLDHAGIDALLDVWQPHSRAQWGRTGIHAAWQSVRFKPRDKKDLTRAFGAERL